MSNLIWWIVIIVCWCFGGFLTYHCLTEGLVTWGSLGKSGFYAITFLLDIISSQ